MNIAVRVYDKYFMRNESRARLSVTVVGHDNEVFISAIGAESKIANKKKRGQEYYTPALLNTINAVQAYT